MKLSLYHRFDEDPNRLWHSSDNHVKDDTIFVFGSNLAGRHGTGAAKYALSLGARYGTGIGLSGKTYAIPTKDENLNVISIEEISSFVEHFKSFARSRSTEYFYVSRIGCGLAGYADSQIAPLFDDSPDNCILPLDWMMYVSLDSTRTASVAFESHTEPLDM